MILVKTKIGLSRIEGIGIFADEFIPKGTPVWKFQEGFDLKIKKEELAKLSEPSKKQFLKYSYLNPETNEYILCFDDSRFFNHSDNPNCIGIVSAEDGEEIDITTRDIQKDEELTCNYKDFTLDTGLDE